MREGKYVEAARYCTDTWHVYDEDDEAIVPLHWAVVIDQLEFAFCLLAHGVSVNEENDDHSCNALSLAVQLPDPSLFHLLLLHPDISDDSITA